MNETCTPCQAKKQMFQQMQTVQAHEESPAECEFKKDTLKLWLETVECYKSKFLYLDNASFPVRKLNSFAGYIKSALLTNPCYFHKELVEIQSFIVIAKSTGEC